MKKKEYPFLDLATVNAPYMAEMTAAAEAVIRSGRYVGGDEVSAFEAELAAALGTEHVVAVANGLDALRLVLRAWMELGALQRGDEVAVPANSFVASALAVTECGLRPFFVDVDSATMNLDWSRLPLHRPSLRAVMPVHLYGRVCHVPPQVKERMLVLEDSAQAIGAAGACTLGHAAALSFYPTKNVGALGDAGAVVTSSAQLAEMVRTLANYGSRVTYRNDYVGVNSRMDPIQAAMLRVKLPHMAEENALRRRHADIYSSTLSNPLVTAPLHPANPLEHVWHQYVVRTPHRAALVSHLESHGVHTAVHYPCAIHRQPCYAPACADVHLPVAEELAGEVLSLPVSRCSADSDIRDIAHIINHFSL